MRRYATPNRVGNCHPRVQTRGYHHSLAPRGTNSGTKRGDQWFCSASGLRRAMNEPKTAEAGVEQPQAPASTHPGAWRRGFWSLFATQFQGAFSDNVFKFLVTFLILGAYGLTTDQRDRLAPVVGAIFALPFILFSMAGGYLADRYSKRSVAIGVKLAEILIMSLGLIGLWLNSVPLLIVVVFLMST